MIKKYKEEIYDLIKFGEKIFNNNTYEESYEIWYSEALALVKSIFPLREKDFVSLYALIKNTIISSDLEKDLKIGSYRDYRKNFKQQLNIIKSIERKFSSSLFEIKHLVQADLFDNELEVAKELNKKGFVRAAGAVAGVVLESHLQEICFNHNIKIIKKNPGINDLAELLKNNNVIEVHQWRKIQGLADLRNLCDHKKKVEPKKEDIDELITGVNKIIKNIF